MTATTRAVLIAFIATIGAATVVPALFSRIQMSGVEVTLSRVAWHLAFDGAFLLSLLALHRFPRATFPILLCISALVRIPFWFQAGIDNDETALILKGQDLLDGHLPFTTGLWDQKPPGAIAAFAMLVAGGRSLLPVRIAGTLLVAVSAWCLTRALRNNQSAGRWAAVMLIVFVSTAGGGQPTLSEHIALLPLAAVIVVATRPASTIRDAALAGVLFGIAVTVRSNLGVVFPGVLLAMVWRAQPPDRARTAAAFTIGCALPMVAIAGIYAARGELAALARGIFVLPFLMSHVSVTGMVWTVDDLVILIVRHARDGAWLLWIAAAAGVFRQRFVAVMLLLVLVSIMAMSAAEQHYLILAMPFLAYFAGIWLADLATDRRMALAIAAGLLIPLIGLAGQYAALGGLLWNRETVFADPVNRVAQYLREHGAEGQYVYAFDETQVAGWLAGACPAGRFADSGQPAVVPFLQAFAGPGATPEGEALEGFKRNPLFVVLSEGEDYPMPDALAARLARDYDRAAAFDRHVVYRRKSGPAPDRSC